MIIIIFFIAAMLFLLLILETDIKLYFLIIAAIAAISIKIYPF